MILNHFSTKSFNIVALSSDFTNAKKKKANFVKQAIWHIWGQLNND